MIKGVHDFYYNVEDMDRAVKFYSEALGMKVLFKSEYWTSMDCEGTMIGLHWTEGGPVPAISKDSHGAHCGGTLTLNSDDVKADRVKLEELGTKILGEMDADWGHMLVFEDTEGNVLKLQKAKY